MLLGSIPERSAKDMSLLIASVCAATVPPALPIAVKTSHRPFSSSFTVTYSVPSPVRMRLVFPSVIDGRLRAVFISAVSEFCSSFSDDLSSVIKIPSLEPSR